jgi:hypothetical protein
VVTPHQEGAAACKSCIVGHTDVPTIHPAILFIAKSHDTTLINQQSSVNKVSKATLILIFILLVSLTNDKPLMFKTSYLFILPYIFKNIT